MNEQTDSRGACRPRVLMTTSVFPRHATDATPAFVRNLARGMVRAGWEVAVLAPHGDGARIAEDDEGVAIRRFPYALPLRLQKLCYEGGMLVNLRQRPWTRWLLPSFFAAQLAATAEAIRWFRPDLVHSHSLLPQGFTSALASAPTGLPHLTTCHGNDVFGLGSTGFSGRAKRWVLGQADAITVNSLETRRAAIAQGGAPARVRLIPAVPNEVRTDSGAADRVRQRWGATTPVIVFAGRMLREKGVGELLDAVARLRVRHPDLRLVLLGDGADRAAFEAQAQANSLGAAVEFTGWLDAASVQAQMGAADLVAVPSRPGPGGWKEAQGLVAVEAMAAGTAVVASDFGGLTDMIEDGVTGYLCRHSCPEALADALDRALADPARVEVAQRARARYEARFSPAAVIQATDALYRQLLLPSSPG